MSRLTEYYGRPVCTRIICLDGIDQCWVVMFYLIEEFFSVSLRNDVFQTTNTPCEVTKLERLVSWTKLKQI